jgi:hypothetical protein
MDESACFYSFGRQQDTAAFSGRLQNALRFLQGLISTHNQVDLQDSSLHGQPRRTIVDPVYHFAHLQSRALSMLLTMPVVEEEWKKLPWARRVVRWTVPF